MLSPDDHLIHQSGRFYVMSTEMSQKMAQQVQLAGVLFCSSCWLPIPSPATLNSSMAWMQATAVIYDQ
jgi:hypothetical protein